MGWTGDAQVFSATASYLADTYAFYRKYLYDMYQEQLLADGMVPEICPHIRTDKMFLRMGRRRVYRGTYICSARTKQSWKARLRACLLMSLCGSLTIAEDARAANTGFDAGRQQPGFDAMAAEGALVGLAGVARASFE